jgi:hypothetical protein
MQPVKVYFGLPVVVPFGPIIIVTAAPGVCAAFPKSRVRGTDEACSASANLELVHVAPENVVVFQLYGIS